MPILSKRSFYENMRMRKKKNLIPRLEKCAALMIEDPSLLSGKWREHFGAPANAAFYVEFGCGKGQFITQMAKNHPDAVFVAVEKEKGALVMALEKAMEMGLSNLLFISGDVSCAESFFRPDEVDRIYINFCDPWPPKRSAKRRLTHRNFLSIYDKILKPGGEIFFKTDNQNLFSFSLLEMQEFGFSLRMITFDLHRDSTHNIMTEYEEKFSSQGFRICRLEAIKPVTK